MCVDRLVGILQVPETLFILIFFFLSAFQIGQFLDVSSSLLMLLSASLNPLLISFSYFFVSAIILFSCRGPIQCFGFFFNNLFVEILYSLNHCHHAFLSVL